MYLLDNPNPNGQHYYMSRRSPLRVLVLHITAGLEDQDMLGPDQSAEQTARYAATTTRQVSWHAGADSDSWLELLPAHYTAWHVRGYNSSTWGIEISKRDTTWRDEPAMWVEATLSNAADASRPIVERYGIPLRLLTRAQVDAGMSGFVYHSELDPDRRTDPGADFPISQFFRFLREDDMTLTDGQDRRLRAVERQVAELHRMWRGGIAGQHHPGVGTGMVSTLYRGRVDLEALAASVARELGDVVDEERLAAELLRQLAEGGGEA